MLKQRSWQIAAVKSTSNTRTAFFEALNHLCACQTHGGSRRRGSTLQRPLSSSVPRQSPWRSGLSNYRPLQGSVTSFSDDSDTRPSYRASGRLRLKRHSLHTNTAGTEDPPRTSVDDPTVTAENLRRKIPLPTSSLPQRLEEHVGKLPERADYRDYDSWEITAKDLWMRYHQLPVPRCSAISRTALRFVLSTLAYEKPKTKKGMLRYLSVIDEMKAQEPPLIPQVEEWTALMSYLARVHKYPSTDDVDKCMDLWDEMENTYGISANLATFNVLLDVCAKSGSWQSLDLLRHEMQSRGIEFDRYTWTTLIHAAGLRRDGDDVRRLARAMVDRGEVLDIVVVNAIISALIRAKEYAEAIHLFQCMQDTMADTASHEKRLGPVHPMSRRTSSFLTSHYQHRARKNQRHLQAGGQLMHEDIAPGLGPLNADFPNYPMPDTATFNMLLKYYCIEAGDFAAASNLLEKMQEAKIDDSQAMYESLFSGFSLHSRHDEAWTLPRLKYVFETLIKATGVKITQSLAIRVIRAFGTLGTERELQDCWQGLDKAWQDRGGDPLRRSSNLQHELESAKAQARLSRRRRQRRRRQDDRVRHEEVGSLARQE